MFQAGFARVDVTPPLGSPLAGYFTDRWAEGVLDPLELNAVAFSDGENRAVLIAADFLYVMENAATEIRELIAEKCSLPLDHVCIQGLHQHTSIRVGTRPHLRGNMGIGDKAYLDVLYRKYCDVAKMALDDLKDAVLSVAERETDPQISFIRRYKMKDGSTRTNPGKKVLDEVVGPIGEPDNTVRLIRIRREAGDDIGLVNFSCHADTVGGSKISADWPGFVRRNLENAVPDMRCVVLGGAEGDTNQVDLYATDGVKRKGYEFCSYFGKVISDTALSLWDQTKPVESGKVWGKVEMKYVPTNTNGIEKVEEAIQYRRDVQEGLKEDPKEMGARANLWRISALRSELLFQKVPVSVLGIGNVAFVGFGGEPFTQYATAAREAGKGLYVITLCLANGGQGYLPTVEAFAEGGYEAASSRFDASVAPTLQDCAASLLAKYREL